MGLKACFDCMAAIGMLFLVLLNVAFFILGIGAIILGKILEKEVDKREEIMDLLDLVKLGDMSLAEIVRLLIVIVIVCGVVVMVTSLTGATGALFRLRVLLIVYAIIVILCIALELVILNFWNNLINGIDELLFGKFSELLKKYGGPVEQDIYSIGWNLVFILFGCCGIRPVTRIQNDFMSLSSDWWLSASRGLDVIPSSCCDDVTVDNYVNYNNTQCTETLIGYAESGCYDVFAELFRKLVDAAISITSFLLFIEFMAIIFSGIIVYDVTLKKRRCSPL